MAEVKIDRPVKAKKRVTFTPDKARRAIVYIQKVCLDLMEADYEAAMMVAAAEEAGVNLTGALDRLDELIAEIEAVGLKVHDSARAVVWFPARKEGKRAWLVWEPKNPDRLTWHYDMDYEVGRPIETFKKKG